MSPLFKTLRITALFSLVLNFDLPSISVCQAHEQIFGDWSLDLESKLPAWMSIQGTPDQPIVFMRLYVGSAGPCKEVNWKDGKLCFTLKHNKKAKVTKTVCVGFDKGRLTGVITSTPDSGVATTEKFTGVKIPPMPASPPDLEGVRYGQPISLFNGRDLSGWTVHESDKINGWSAENGVLKNSTPKTDFSATGDHANLKTKAVFEDFWLHIEFLVEEKRNSGVYLRGMYEAQVVDRDSPMQGIQGVGAIFGMLKPSENAGKPGGQWQTYDITLVDRHVTVVLNGRKVIDNQPVTGPTAGAILTNPAEPGPIYLQGDHTNVAYRNIYLAPVLRD